MITHRRYCLLLDDDQSVQLLNDHELRAIHGCDLFANRLSGGRPIAKPESPPSARKGCRHSDEAVYPYFDELSDSRWIHPVRQCGDRYCEPDPHGNLETIVL